MNLHSLGPGRPLRFLYIVLGLWVSGRGAVLLMEQGVEDRNRPEQGERGGGPANFAVRPPLPMRNESSRPVPTQSAGRSPRANPVAVRLRIASAGLAERPLLIAAGRGSGKPVDGLFDRPAGLVPGAPWVALPGKAGVPGRWSLSAWMLYRPDNNGSGLASAGQLGASQIGARLAYDLSPSSLHSIAIHARVTSALESPVGAEAALGLTWRPRRSVPLALSIERRAALYEGGRNAFAAYAAGGFGPMPIGQGVQAEGYAQAGVVGAQRTDAFADGCIAIAGKVLDDGHGAAITAGVALSGGAQPSLSRLDFGPQVSARFRLGDGYARAGLEWRERILGSARPASGPAFVLAAEF